jgi:hypothetical protein
MIVSQEERRGPKMSDAQSIMFEAVQTNDRWGCVVRATWPDGYEQEITGFIDEAEARAWIANDSQGWLDWIPHRPQLGT